MAVVWSFPPNFLVPGLAGDVLGSRMSEKKRAIELSDGGHFENLALYELIRRKPGLIIASDAGADPDFLFGDLANAVERIGVDFGARIRFEDKKYGLTKLLPGSGPKGMMKKKYNIAKKGFALAKITYYDGTEGDLIYIKTTLIDDLPASIYGYKNANPAFPDQSTTDQFFDEKQFEAYRELGYQVTQRMFEDTRVQDILDLVTDVPQAQ